MHQDELVYPRDIFIDCL